MRKILGSKIHRARVTHADLDYEGSLTVPPELLEAADIRPYEAVAIWNVTNGARVETYAIEGEAGTHDICANGAAAHLVRAGDVVIIATFRLLNDAQLKGYRPTVVFVNERNEIVERREEVAGPGVRADC